MSKEKLLNEYEHLNREHYKIFGLCLSGWIFDFYDLILFTFLIIPISFEFQVTNFTISFVLGASLLAAAVGGVILGILSDQHGRKKVLQWTIVIYSLGTFLCAFSPNVESLIIFRIITGLGIGGEWAAGQTFVGETVPPKYRGFTGALLQMGGPLGFILAAIVGGFIAPEIGWRECFLLSAIPALMVILIRTKISESDVWLKNRESKSKIRRSFTLTENKFFLLFSKPYRKLFCLSLILAIIGSSAYWLTFSWLPDYLYSERNLSLAKSALWIILSQLGAIIGHIIFGLTADYLGRRPAFTIFSFIMALGIVMITMLWVPISVYPVLIMIFMFLVGFGTGLYGGFGPLMSELFPTSVRNTAMGSSFNLARGVQFFTPVIIAIIGGSYGLSSGIFIAALFALSIGLWVWTLPETKGKKLQELENNRIKLGN